jgi:hypothetical protein
MRSNCKETKLEEIISKFEIIKTKLVDTLDALIKELITTLDRDLRELQQFSKGWTTTTRWNWLSHALHDMGKDLTNIHRPAYGNTQSFQNSITNPTISFQDEVNTSIEQIKKLKHYQKKCSHYRDFKVKASQLAKGIERLQRRRKRLENNGFSLQQPNTLSQIQDLRKKAMFANNCREANQFIDKAEEQLEFALEEEETIHIIAM